ncbi:MAG TPA: xanthine dehydrogenase family protein molybdopterin-binding subunit [Anaerolineaceae bacterium]|nr:xanthine dehydrogenase family protein molybdopterin-binding subunit [Anaerolineaceae bacterium]
MLSVGESVARIDADGKVRGQTNFPGDINLPNQAYAKILFAKQPHARIISIDASPAEAVPGVLLVLTSRDVPVNEYGLIMPDQPVLCGPSSKPYTDRVRCIGDQVAMVVAVSEEIAAEACKMIKVEYQDLPVVTDPRLAIEEDAVLLHPDRGSNVFCHYRIRKGVIESGFDKADVIVDGVYQTPVQEHAFLQPEAGLGYIDEQGRITVVVGGQWTHEDQEQIAHALNLPKDRIRVIYPAIGGAFGGREDMSIQIVLALAAWELSKRGNPRPVKIIWSREESIIGHHKRHPFYIKAKWGATRAGKIVAAEIEMIADGGGYAYTSTKVLGNATLLCTGAYNIPNVKVDAYAVYTNNVLTGAFRGFGGPQALFQAEMQVDKLAEKLGLDPVELRMRNLIKEGDLLSVGTPLPKGVTIDKVVEKCVLAAGWVKTEAGWKKPELAPSAKSNIRRGIGFACGYKNVGFSFGAPELCVARIELYGTAEIEQAVVYHSGADVGQGAHTVFAQMAAQGLNLPIEKIKLVVSDTAFTPPSGSASASRMTFMAGNAIKGAAEKALERWKNEERPAVATYEYRPPKTTPFDPETGKSEPNFAYGYVAEAVETEVDIETGEVRLAKVICTDDVGQAINPALVKGQIEGAVVQAAGYAMLENFVQKNGDVLTRYLSTYLIPTVLDIPGEIQAEILEYPDPIGPWGARGMGEMPYLSLVPAITGSVHDATGVWFDSFPLTPERVLRGTGKLEENDRQEHV